MRKTNLILVVIGFIAINFFQSCSIFKKRTTDLQKTSFSSKVETKSTSDSSAKIVDKTTKTVKEVLETSTESPAVNIKKDSEGVSLKDLAKGIKSIDSGLYSVKVTYDSAAKKLTTEVNKKPEKTQSKKTTETTTHNDVTTETAHSIKKQNNEAVSAESKRKATVSEPKGLAWLWIIIATVVTLVIIGLLIYFKK